MMRLAAGVAAAGADGAMGLVMGAGAVVQGVVYGGGALVVMKRRNRVALRALEARGESLPPVPTIRIGAPTP